MLRSLEVKVAPLILALLTAVCMGAWLWGGELRPNSYWLRILTVLVMAGTGLAVIACTIQNLLHAQTLFNRTDPTSAAPLVTQGAYSWSRNPMYVGLLVLLLAIARAFDSFPLYLGPLLFFLWLDRLEIPKEERELRERFGDEYAKYTSEVRRWL
jgi:protein-S-isoprenylcysteine O-methyltransferase Ste14